MRNFVTLIALVLAAALAPVPTFAQTPEEQPEQTPTETRARTVEADVDNTPDPIASLRDQIQAAATASERNQLRLKLASLLLTSDRRTEALAELKVIAASTDFDPIGFYNLGNAFARLGDIEAAIKAYETAIEQRNGNYSRAYNNLGVVLLHSGRWDEAQEALLSALKIENFRYAEASYNLGRVYSVRGEQDRAAREWRRALAVDPKHDAAAAALAHDGREERIVVRSSTASKKREPNNKSDVDRTVAAQPASTKPSTAVEPAATASRKPLELDPASYSYLQRARDASERGKLTDAVTNFKRVLSRQDGYFPPANLELSYALLTLKRYDEALDNLLEVSKRDGTRYPISYFHLARVYELKGELNLAEAAFSQAATSYGPSNAQFLLDLSRVREKRGNYKGSLESMEQYLKHMQEQGLKPAWSDDRLAALRTKAATQQ